MEKRNDKFRPQIKLKFNGLCKLRELPLQRGNLSKQLAGKLSMEMIVFFGVSVFLEIVLFLNLFIVSDVPLFTFFSLVVFEELLVIFNISVYQILLVQL